MPVHAVAILHHHGAGSGCAQASRARRSPRRCARGPDAGQMGLAGCAAVRTAPRRARASRARNPERPAPAHCPAPSMKSARVMALCSGRAAGSVAKALARFQEKYARCRYAGAGQLRPEPRQTKSDHAACRPPNSSFSRSSAIGRARKNNEGRRRITAGGHIMRRIDIEGQQQQPRAHIGPPGPPSWPCRSPAARCAAAGRTAFASSAPPTIATSRAITSTTSQNGDRLRFPQSARKQRSIRSLSAMGSSQAPIRDVKPQRRAIKPSARSLKLAATNIDQRGGVMIGQDRPGRQRRRQKAQRRQQIGQMPQHHRPPPSAARPARESIGLRCRTAPAPARSRRRATDRRALIGDGKPGIADIHRHHLHSGDSVRCRPARSGWRPIGSRLSTLHIGRQRAARVVDPPPSATSTYPPSHARPAWAAAGIGGADGLHQRHIDAGLGRRLALPQAADIHRHLAVGIDHLHQRRFGRLDAVGRRLRHRSSPHCRN